MAHLDGHSVLVTSIDSVEQGGQNVASKLCHLLAESPQGDHGLLHHHDQGLPICQWIELVAASRLHYLHHVGRHRNLCVMATGGWEKD